MINIQLVLCRTLSCLYAVSMNHVYDRLRI